MWRSWLSRSPTPSRHERKDVSGEEDVRCRSATLPRPQTQHDDEDADKKPNSSSLKRGRFDFLRPKRWRTLSRSRHSSPKKPKSTSPDKHSETAHNSSDGSSTPTNEQSNRMTLPLGLNDSISTEMDDATPKAEDANELLKAALKEKYLKNSETGRLSRKDMTKAHHERDHTTKRSLFTFGRKTPDRSQSIAVSLALFVPSFVQPEPTLG
ncbi:unnamed protein product [Rodentolepis nana]|uniref:SMAP domain-containing protein n=1 Tax=Rodentolepis nana TaxID=102285 RepID=A0A0R3TTS6_RODNA|nr:unnamed protein product [Rodentolepis nana]